MWVRTLRAVASIGPAGTLKDIDRPSAKALMVLGFVEEAEKPEPPKPELPKRTYQRKDVSEEKPKRVYRRKDMVAEEPTAEVIIQEPEASPESEENENAIVRLRD